MSKARQLTLALPQRGGKRRGALRKPRASRPQVSHKARPRFGRPTVIHVTLRVAPRVWNLRSRRCFRAIEASFEDARERFGLRVIEFTILGNHLHLLVEADSDSSLSRGMQGLAVRMARALNKVMQRHGSVFADHYHSLILKTPTQVVNALAYVLGNYAHHFGGTAGRDPFSSATYGAQTRLRVLSTPTTWMLRVGWRRGRLVPQWLCALLERSEQSTGLLAA